MSIPAPPLNVRCATERRHAETEFHRQAVLHNASHLRPPVARCASCLRRTTPSTRPVVTGLLKAAGHSVRVTPNGRDALAAIESEPFDVVLMDVQMPVMDGFEATAAIRAAEA